MLKQTYLIAVFTLLACAITSPSTLAEDQTISVVAVGEAEVRPDTIVLNGSISESNEKMKDAVTAFRDTRRRAMASIDAMKIENMTVKASAMSIDLSGGPVAAGPFGDVAEAAPAGALTLSQSVTLTVTGLDKMQENDALELVIKIITGVKEAGIEMGGMSQQDMMMMQMGMGGMGGASPLQFKISNPQAAQKQATRNAMQKARENAQFLAELSGGKLGPVVAISEGPAGDDEQATNPYAMMFGMMIDQGESEFASTSLDPIKVASGLSVRFRLITE